MKKLLLACALFTSLAAFSQGRDIEVTLLKPMANERIISGQPFDIEYVIRNSGNVSTNTTDSMIIIYFLNNVSMPNINGQNPAFYTNVVLAPGDTIWRKFRLNLTYSNLNGPMPFCVRVYAQTANRTIDSNQANNTSCNSVVMPVNEVIKALQNLEVYPNPASTVLNIAFDYKPATQITVMDMGGRVIRSEKVNGTLTSLDVNDLGNGMYLYNIIDRDGAIIKTGRFNIAR